MSALEKAEMSATPPAPATPWGLDPGSPRPIAVFCPPAMLTEAPKAVPRPSAFDLQSAYQLVLTAEEEYRRRLDAVAIAYADAQTHERVMVLARTRFDEMTNEARQTWRTT